MSYEVVARRWRPLTFASVVGQSHVTGTLANAIRRDRIPHAFLLTGTRGVGKTTIARLLARAINCTARRDTAEPCNECPSCRQGIAGNSLDIIEIDGASNNGVDEVRDLIEGAQYRPSAGRFKVYIIDEVHQLSKPAFNALLKTLEEPPAHVKFIMATTEVHKLPATVLSRCQRYDFRRLSTDEIARQLTEIAAKDGLAISADGIALVAREADGSMRDAQSLFEQVMAGADGPLDAAAVAALLGVAGAELVTGCVEAVLQGDASRVVGLAADVRRFGYDVERLVGEVLEVLRHVTVATVAGLDALPEGLPEDHRRVVAAVKGRRSALDLQRIFSSLLGTASDLRRGSHPDLVFEMGLLKVASLEPVETAAALLARLGVMEAQGRGFAPGPAQAGRSPQAQASGARPAPAAPPPQAAGTGGRGAAGPSAARPVAASAAAGTAATATRGEVAEDSRRAASPSQAAPPHPAEAAEAPRATPAAPEARLPLAGRPDPASVEAWTGPEGEPLAPLTEDEARNRRWEAFLDGIKKYGLDLYVTITNCRLISHDEGHVAIRPSSATFATKLRNPTVMGRVTEVAREHFGPAVQVRVVEGAAAAPDEGVSLQGIQDERTARKKQAALADPYVDKLVGGAGGRVTKVTVLED